MATVLPAKSLTIRQFDFSVNLVKALLWEYGTAQPTIQQLITLKQTWYDTNQENFWADWFTNVFDLRTCNDFGCVVWAIILGISTNLLVAPTPNARQPLGFDATNKTNYAPGPNNFNFSSTSGAQITFTTAQKRLVLQLRYRQLISKPTIPEINKILADLIAPVGGGKCYMIDNHNMTQTLTCEFLISAQLNLILTEFDVIPRGQGVSMNVVSTIS